MTEGPSSSLVLLRAYARRIAETRLACAIFAMSAQRSRRRRARKEPCHGCGRTLLNQRLLSPVQLLLGGWTCAFCGHAHRQRRGKMLTPPLQPAE